MGKTWRHRQKAKIKRNKRLQRAQRSEHETARASKNGKRRRQA